MKKIILSLASISAASLPLAAISCSNQIKIDYDLGLVTQPINSLNYIKFATVAKILPSIVEGPLKPGASESLKIRLNLPEIPMGVYGNDSESNSMEEFLKNHKAPSESASRFYPLDQFGSTTGNISADRSVYQPISVVMTPNNNILSMNILLNDGDSKWSNGDPIQADDYLDAMHYILDISTGSQKQISIIQNKFRYSSDIVEAQKAYIRKHKKAYVNPFAYPDLIKNEDGKWVYDTKNYKPWASQNAGDEKEVEAIKTAALGLGFSSGRLYWNYANRTILSAIPYSPDFNPNDDETVVMLPNPEYSLAKHTAAELANINQRIATKIHKYTYFDFRQGYNTSLLNEELISKSKVLKAKLGNVSYDDKNIEAYNKEVNKLYASENVLDNDFLKTFNARKYMKNRLLAMDEYSFRVEYDDYQPASLSNAYSNLTSMLVPINRKFVESIGGIEQFGLDEKKFLTNGPFTIDNLVLGPQGYITLKKNVQYYMSGKTISNKIKIYFSNDPNINAAMYDDGYVAATRVPAVQQMKFWSNKKYRLNMKKSSGFGTIALAFNLDKETNENSYINDPYLRNAIYYAIDRNAMLNLVGWNSSYPVITWTAFGQGSSSFGDAIEIGFDHEGMHPEVEYDKNDKNKTYIPVENYTHIDHLSKNYNFEHVDRTDKAFRLDIARQFINYFKIKHPDVNGVTLKYISNSTDEQQNAGLALQDFMRKAFDGYVNIEIKGLPETVYEDYRTTGKYDIVYKNFDAFGTDSYSYIKTFFLPDEINSADQKKSGFRNNPAGGWTYQKYFENRIGYHYDKATNKIVAKDDLWARTKQNLYLDISDKVWNKIVELSFKKPNESDNDYTKRFMSFLTGQFTEEEKSQGWIEKDIFAIVAAFEKIVRDGAPVVPLMEVDTYWEISRVGGVESLYTYSLQFAYDIAKPPRADLPTVIKI